MSKIVYLRPEEHSRLSKMLAGLMRGELEPFHVYSEVERLIAERNVDELRDAADHILDVPPFPGEEADYLRERADDIAAANQIYRKG